MATSNRFSSEIRDLRIIAQRVMTSGNEGIATLIYYAAELLERQQSVSLDVAHKAIARGEGDNEPTHQLVDVRGSKSDGTTTS